MKIIRTRWVRLLAVIGLFAGAPYCQAADPIEESAKILAAYIAADTGKDPAVYMDYARNLAKTLQSLSVPKQKEVFGPAVYAQISGIVNNGKMKGG